MVRIPLRNRHKEIVAYALVDDADGGQAEHTWHLNNCGYAVREIRLPNGRKRALLLHREILGLSYKDGWDGAHLNGHPTDCQRHNLCKMTRAQNLQSVRAHRDAACPYRGVQRHQGRWRIRAMLYGVTYELGCFDTAEEANEVGVAWRKANLPYATY